MLLFSLLQLTAFAQNKVTGTIQVDLSNYYTKSQTDSIFKVSGGVVKPPVKKPDCQKGPDVWDIRDITMSSATLQFDGQGVDTLQFEVWKIGGAQISSGLIAPKSSIVSIGYPSQTGSANLAGYTLVIRGYSCKSDDDRRDFKIKSDVGGGVVIPPAPVTGKSKVLGAYTERKNGRNFTFNKTGRLALTFNEDGTISDGTKGLNTSGKIHTVDGRNVFYAIGYAIDETPTGEYRGFQNVYLPDGIYTIRQFVVDADKIPSQSAFRTGFDGWPKPDGNPGVNIETGEMSEIFISIFSDKKEGNGSTPDWLRVSRALNAPNVLPAMDWAPYNRTFSTGYINRGDSQVTYQRVGMQPYIDLGNEARQPDTWHTIKSGHEGFQSDDYLKSLGRHFAERMGPSIRSVITSELGENSQGKDPDEYGRVQQTYKAAFELYKELGLTDNPLYTGLFGDYGGENYHGYFNEYLLFYDRPTFEKSLTTHLHKGFGALSNGDFGFSDNDHQFYTRDHIGVRNLNNKYYFWNRVYYLPYELIYANEKTKLGTKTWQGVDRERKVSTFTTVKIESFVANNKGQKTGIEQARTGEIIPFPGGEILTKFNSQPPAPWDEMYTTSLWSMLLTGGIQLWDAPGSAFGQDESKLHWWSDKYVGWRKNGEQDFRPFNSGQDGAPEESYLGLTHTLFAPPLDAAAAGAQVVYDIRDRLERISAVSYKSSLGEFFVKPGSAGFNLNGFGPINRNFFFFRDAMDQKKAIVLVCEGKGGVALVYYNGYLSPRDYEDNVIIRYAGTDYNLGRVYGRQTIIKKI
jgi:hypothetical protein